MARKQEPKTIPPGFELRNLADALMDLRGTSSNIAAILETVCKDQDFAKLNEHLQTMLKIAKRDIDHLHGLFIYRDTDEV